MVRAFIYHAMDWRPQSLRRSPSVSVVTRTHDFCMMWKNESQDFLTFLVPLPHGRAVIDTVRNHLRAVLTGLSKWAQPERALSADCSMEVVLRLGTTVDGQ